MLLEFRAKNYKSFKDELVFSLMPAPKQRALNYSVFREKIGKKVYRGLCSAVIYGANAAGKTNIIGAMDTFKSIVLRGHIRNDTEKSSPNIASGKLEFIPNKFCETQEPVEFSISFTTEGTLIEYTFSALLGRFLDADFPRKIVSERLDVNKVTVFERNEKLEIGQLKAIESLLVNEFDQNASRIMSAANLNDEELFLMNGFKVMFSSKLVSMIINWLNSRFLVVYGFNVIEVRHMFLNDIGQETAYIEKTLNDVAMCFGINSNALGYIAEKDGKESRLCSLFREDGEAGIAIPAKLFESYGTIRFVNMFPFIIQVLQNGGTLVVDEFDASIHPMALMNIVNIFHNDELNLNHAQLVFNTHNPIFLNPNLFRRDEIKFVERDEESHCSTHYSLSDFGTAGRSGVRRNSDYMKGYFVNRYGAIKNIDFSPVIKEILSNDAED